MSRIRRPGLAKTFAEDGPKEMNREEEKSRSTCSEDGDRAQDKLANISTLGHQLTQLEAHLRRSLETQAEKEKQIAHLKEALQEATIRYEDERKDHQVALARAKLECEKEIRSKDDEWKTKLEEQRAKFEIEIEGTKIKQNSDILKLAKDLRNEMESVEDQLRETKKIGEELSIENQKLKAQIVETGRALLKTRETSAKLEDELHSVRLNLLKEGNMKDRVLDELKRAAREVARLTEAGEQLKKRADKRQSDMGQKINEIHKMFVLNSTKRVEEEMVNARLDLASLGKGQASLMVRLEEVDRYLRCGGAQTATVGVQTTLAADRMKQFEEAGRDTAEMVIRLREEMVDCKSQMIETKQQNEVLRQIIRDLKRSKEEAELVEQEDAARIASLERNFLDIRQFLEGSGRATQQPTVNLAEELETLRRELGELKGRQRTAPNPRFRTQTLPNNRPGNTQENWR